MVQIGLNDELSLTCPEGFCRMGEEEIRSLPVRGDFPQEAVRDPERHMIGAFAWKRFGGLVSLLAGEKDAVKSMEKNIGKAMRPFGYRLEEFFPHQLGPLPAEGFRYIYEAQGTAMTGESLIAKSGKTYYYLHFYYRTALAEESRAVVKAILDSAETV